MTTFDPRVTPARPDLAARHLQGKVQAARYVPGTECEVIVPTAPLRGAPQPSEPLVTEALLGERVMVYDVTEEGWAWGQLLTDSYVGWLPSAALAPPGAAATHCVRMPRTLVLQAPDVRAPLLLAPTLGARLAIARVENRFAVTATGGFVPAHHLRALSQRPESDFVTVAERMLGVPYLWGGRTPLGFDCSGLVQIALGAAGIRVPRDADQQEAVLGEPVAVGADLGGVRRGDLVFWPGHVAIVSDPQTLVHANAWHMMVALEPLAPALARIAAAGSKVRAVKRLPVLGG